MATCQRCKGYLDDGHVCAGRFAALRAWVADIALGVVVGGGLGALVAGALGAATFGAELDFLGFLFGAAAMVAFLHWQRRL